MTDLRIKSETLPERCEICHQTDCFDPLTNHCSRCAVIIDPASDQVTANSLAHHTPVHDAPGLRQQVTLGRDTKFETTIRRSLSELDNGVLKSIEQRSQEQFTYRVVIITTAGCAIGGAAALTYFNGAVQLIGGFLIGGVFGLFFSAFLASILWTLLQTFFRIRDALRDGFHSDEVKRLRGERQQEQPRRRLRKENHEGHEV